MNDYVIGPIHLAWMVKKVEQLARMAGNTTPHAACPRGESGYQADPAATSQPHKLLHHPDKLDGVEVAEVNSASRSTSFTTRTSRGGSARKQVCRTGTALVVVLVALAVTTLLFMAAMKMILVERKTIELSSRQIQAGWLAESGIQRAATLLAADAKYRGETWNVSAEDLGGRDGGIVTIKVEKVSGKTDRRAVHVEADFPPEPEQRARERRDVIVRVRGYETK
jgi:hypothetical protein